MPRPRWLSLAAVIAATAACFDAAPHPPTDVPADLDAPRADVPLDAAAPDTIAADAAADLVPDITQDAASDVAPDADDVPPPDAAPCAAAQLRCEGLCTDVASNNTHCGRCGNTCLATQTCRAGACADEPPCPAAQQRCRDACVDTGSDVANCGACGNACPSGQACSGGACAPRPTCPADQTACGSACVDPRTDGSHCGACGAACPAGQSCQAGACRVPILCPAGQSPCGGACVDTSTDLAHCGACGTRCAMGQVCADGTCRMMDCTAGQLRCGAACVATDTDEANCGVCGRACAAGQTCTAGVCAGAITCPAGQTRCSEACASTAADPLNCGACGRPCPTGNTCAAGACVAPRPACPTGQTDCAPAAPAPGCVNLATSATNCGACGRTCPSGLTCAAGVCVCPTGRSLCGRLCVDLQTDDAHCAGCGRACTSGQTCQTGACRCPTGRTLCNGACVDGQSDEAHCGACGTACGAGQTCQAGRCACPTGQTACGEGAAATCADTTTDRLHCGACGRACATGHACVGGACACPAGQTTCAGACVDATSNAAHCGACGRACAAGTACRAGACMGAPPANDTRAGAAVIDLTSPAQTLAADTAAARNDTRGACGCTSGNDVFYRFTLAAPEVVYADTLAATWDTALFFQDAAGANVMAAAPEVACNDDLSAAGLCLRTGLQSQVVARLGAGTWYLVLSGCGAGAARVNFQHLPAGNGASTRVTPNATVQTATGTTSGAGTVSGTCCTGGPEGSHWWVTCPDTAAQSFHATTCSATTGLNQVAYDNALAQYSALRGAAAQVCNDDTGALCATGATLSATIPATTGTQGGLNVLVADACAGAGAYAVQYVLSNCASGARCGASCVDTGADAGHCGGCNRRCPAGNACAGGACAPPPPNDLPAGAVVIDMTRPQSIFSVDTRAATHQAAGPCGCTAGRDVFYNFTVPAAAPEIIYADTLGSTWDTSLFVQTSAGVNVTAPGLPANGAACNDDGGLAGCGTGLQSQIMLLLNPGAYRLVASGCGTGGATSVRFQHLPVGNGPVAFLPEGASTPAGTTAGVGRVSLGCSAGGPENTYYWYRCPSATTTSAFTASTCGRATWDTTLVQYSPGRTTPGPSVCNDDACPAAAPRQSAVTSTLPAGPGLHALYVDGFGVGAGAYSVSVQRL